MRIRLLLVLISVLLPRICSGQVAAPVWPILVRTTMIEYGNERGTIFAVNVDGREYWITAKHILTGAQQPPYGRVVERKVKVHLLAKGEPQQRWVETEMTVIDTTPRIDIVVLYASSPLIPSGTPSLELSTKGLGLGDECSFIGFPYGGGYRVTMRTGGTIWLPYVKHCIISALAGDNTGPAQFPDVDGLFILDGINNPGFSGSPVLYGSGEHQRIFGVISGFSREPMDIFSAVRGGMTNVDPPVKPPPNRQFAKNDDNVALVNSGFIVAFSMDIALSAIRANPNGPPVSAQNSQ